MPSLRQLKKRLQGCDKSVKSNVLHWTRTIQRKELEKKLAPLPELTRKLMLKCQYYIDAIDVAKLQLIELETYHISSTGVQLGIRATCMCIEIQDPAERTAKQKEVLGTRPGKLHMLHRCDNPLCAKKEHLFWGTTVDNQRDAALKGRHSRQSHGLTTVDEVIAHKRKLLQNTLDICTSRLTKTRVKLAALTSG